MAATKSLGRAVTNKRPVITVAKMKAAARVNLPPPPTPPANTSGIDLEKGLTPKGTPTATNATDSSGNPIPLDPSGNPTVPYTDPATGNTFDPSTGLWTDPTDGATYDPKTQQWSGGKPYTDPNTGYVYDPVRDTWTNPATGSVYNNQTKTWSDPDPVVTANGGHPTTDASGAPISGASGGLDAAGNPTGNVDTSNTVAPVLENTTRAITGDNPVPIVASHARMGLVRTICMVLTKLGLWPVAWQSKCPGQYNGPVNVGAEYSDSALNAAIQYNRAMMQKMVTVESLKAEAQSLVNRARQGDENAMAIISMIRQNRQKGNQRAIMMYQFIADYIKASPASGFGAERTKPKKPPSMSYWTALQFANGEPITKDSILSIVSQLDPQSQQLFYYGLVKFNDKGTLREMRTQLDDVGARILDAGRILGLAKAIQMVRMPGTPVTPFNERVGWELGE